LALAVVVALLGAPAFADTVQRTAPQSPAQVRLSFATLMRDVERVCSRCRSTGRCRRELDAGTAAAHAHEYCPNAGTFDDLIDHATSL